MITYNNIAKTCSSCIVSQSITRDGSARERRPGLGARQGAALRIAVRTHVTPRSVSRRKEPACSEFVTRSRRTAFVRRNSHQPCQCQPMPWMRSVALANAASVPARHSHSGSNNGCRNPCQQRPELSAKQQASAEKNKKLHSARRGEGASPAAREPDCRTTRRAPEPGRDFVS